MFTDPQTLTVDTASLVLARQGTSSPETLGRFVTPDGEFEFTVRQNKTANRFRREIRLTQKKVAADPISAINKELSASAIVVVDEPRWGFTDEELGALLVAITSYAADGDTQGKLFGGES